VKLPEGRDCWRIERVPALSSDTHVRRALMKDADAQGLDDAENRPRHEN